jgi:uracil-DNA glycosylase
VLRALGLKLSAWPFAHGRLHRLPRGRQLFDSYHCSRYNTQTGRLTPAMFREAVARAAGLEDAL